MASQIRSIYTNILAIDIAVGGNTVATRDLDEFDGQVHTMPVRILTPLSSPNDDGLRLQPMTFGGRSSIEWKITDLMLWASATDGSSIEYHVPKLVEYAGAFADAFVTQMATDRTLGLTNVVVDSVDNIEIGVYNYPAESGDFYYGAKTLWRVRENL